MVIPVPYCEDNFCYIVLKLETKHFYLVDPGDFGAVAEALEFLGIQNTGLKGVFTTHKHWDHSGHNYQFAREFPGLTIYGGQNEGVPECNQPLHDN